MERRNKIWMHYVKNIIAADVSSAVFLASFLKHKGPKRDFSASLEVFDLQRYKVIRKPEKVRVALVERKHLPFVFIVGKN